MNREVHVRFWESPEVKVLRATRQNPPCAPAPRCLLSPGADMLRQRRVLGGWRVQLTANSPCPGCRA